MVYGFEIVKWDKRLYNHNNIVFNVWFEASARCLGRGKGEGMGRREGTQMSDSIHGCAVSITAGEGGL